MGKSDYAAPRPGSASQTLLLYTAHWQSRHGELDHVPGADYAYVQHATPGSGRASRARLSSMRNRAALRTIEERQVSAAGLPMRQAGALRPSAGQCAVSMPSRRLRSPYTANWLAVMAETRTMRAPRPANRPRAPSSRAIASSRAPVLSSPARSATPARHACGRPFILFSRGCRPEATPLRAPQRQGHAKCMHASAGGSCVLCGLLCVAAGSGAAAPSLLAPADAAPGLSPLGRQRLQQRPHASRARRSDGRGCSSIGAGAAC